MPKTVKAVTVTKDYLNRKIWVVKLLSVFNRKDGTPYWFVTNIIDSDPDFETVLDRGIHYCVEKNVAFMHSVNHGQNLTEQQKDILARYDKEVT